jgi:hypothetical protein
MQSARELVHEVGVPPDLVLDTVRGQCVRHDAVIERRNAEMRGFGSGTYVDDDAEPTPDELAQVERENTEIALVSAVAVPEMKTFNRCKRTLAVTEFHENPSESRQAGWPQYRLPEVHHAGITRASGGLNDLPFRLRSSIPFYRKWARKPPVFSRGMNGPSPCKHACFILYQRHA